MNAWKKALVKYFDRHFTGEYVIDEPLSLHTWYRIGGPADFLVYPRDPKDLIALLRQCQTLEVERYFIGEGANVLVSDAGYRGVIINLTRYFTGITRTETIITVSAGVLLQDLVLFSETHSLGGVAYLSGIPGTIGGALMMNAGTNQGEIGDTVSEVYLLNDAFEPVVVPREHITFNYRSVPQLQEKPLLGCQLQLYHAEEALLREIRLTQLTQRAAKQPLDYPSCGSVFKRPTGYYVGKMVEELGLKGLRYGDAMISKKHGGFIVNLGNATADHVRYLIEKIQAEVYQHFGIQLEPEVKLVGF